MHYKVDLHTHSTSSFDGGLTKNDYTKILADNILDVIAITDHNTILFAKEMKKVLGEKIIVGEEIKSRDGEIIGLFLEKEIPSGLSAKDTIMQIKKQGGIVYLPHPFEKQRDSMQLDTINLYKKDIDIIEIFNARSFGRTTNAKVSSDLLLPFAASSDAHCKIGIGTAFSIVDALPTKENLKKHLKNATYAKQYASILAYACPLYNKIRKIFYE